ncbi:MAG: GNAT family N-acetyltransferase [Lactobacillales bacterium]|jgi:predicted GNAT family N-acyltransferase|nr:GNAT family N-acetyltransferase [Lactobacillales bacterium]
MNLIYSNQRWNQAAAFFVRMNVFVIEQKISIQDEFSQIDQEDTRYFVIYDNEKPVATACFQELEGNAIQPDRVCVLKEYRKLGLGTQLLNAIEAHTGAKFSRLHAEISAIEFYEKLGYKISGGYFKEDGIPVVRMIKQLR